ncbi:hypothetical protein GGR56DRAFT_57686 [Xylariaceae sp. FL0804]|nr:hypothetical protein GGR56DRAFT_57686 [Xylariaceae sp. FL0804]
MPLVLPGDRKEKIVARRKVYAGISNGRNSGRNTAHPHRGQTRFTQDWEDAKEPAVLAPLSRPRHYSTVEYSMPRDTQPAAPASASHRILQVAFLWTGRLDCNLPNCHQLSKMVRPVILTRRPGTSYCPSLRRAGSQQPRKGTSEHADRLQSCVTSMWPRSTIIYHVDSTEYYLTAASKRSNMQTRSTNIRRRLFPRFPRALATLALLITARYLAPTVSSRALLPLPKPPKP